MSRGLSQSMVVADVDVTVRAGPEHEVRLAHEMRFAARLPGASLDIRLTPAETQALGLAHDTQSRALLRATLAVEADSAVFERLAASILFPNGAVHDIAIAALE